MVYGGMWWFMVECGGLWWSVVVYGGMWCGCGKECGSQNSK